MKEDEGDLADVTVLALLLGIFEGCERSSVQRRHLSVWQIGDGESMLVSLGVYEILCVELCE